MTDQRCARMCSRQTCTRDAVCTLTYVYADSTAVIGELSARSEPHAYDLCGPHADRMTGPRGWRVVRLDSSGEWDAQRHDSHELSPGLDHAGQQDAVPESDPEYSGGRRVLRDVSYHRAVEDHPEPQAEAPEQSAAPEAVPWNSVPMPPSMHRGHLRHP